MREKLGQMFLTEYARQVVERDGDELELEYVSLKEWDMMTEEERLNVATGETL